MTDKSAIIYQTDTLKGGICEEIVSVTIILILLCTSIFAACDSGPKIRAATDATAPLNTLTPTLIKSLVRY